MKIKITKQTYRDLQSQFDDLSIPGYITDHDDDFIYVREWMYHGEGVKIPRTLRYNYSVSGEGKVSVDRESAVEVIRDTSYNPVAETELEKSLLAKVEKLLAKFSGSERDVNIIKQFNEDTYTVIEPLYIAFGEVDGHGDTYKNEDAVYQLVKSVNEANEAGRLQPALFHKHKTKTFSIGPAYVNEEEAMLGDQKVPALQPLVEITFNSAKAYEARKEGRLTGLSIGSLGTVELVKSLLDELKGSVKPKRLIKSFDLTHRNAHLSYTDPSCGGPASLKNWLIEKSMATKVDLNEPHAKLLEELEEEFVELDKKLFDDTNVETAPSTSVISGAGVDNKTETKGNESDMSEELQKQIAEQEKLVKELQAQLIKKDLEVSLTKYELGEDTASFSEALVTLDEVGRTSILKALDSVIAKSEAKVAEVTTAKEEVEAELTKAKAIPAVQTELAKALSQEQGHAEGQAPSTEGMSLAQKLSAQNAKQQ